MLNIGPRIKYFRQRAGISQMDLELATDCAFGSISRFEAGKVHPTKQTLEYLGQALKLTDMEMDYLTGSFSLPATSNEVESAKAEVSKALKERGLLGYLVDERWRVHAYSKTFARFLGLTPEMEAVIGPKILDKTLIEIMLRPDLKIRDFLGNDESNYNLRMLLRCYYQEEAYMIDDPYFIRTLDAIKNDPVASDIWTEIVAHPDDIRVTTNEERRIYFKIAGLTFCLNFNNQNLHKNYRFKLVQYIPNNKLIRLLSKVL